MNTIEKQVREILRQAKRLGAEYYALTKKPLGVTGEVAELEAADALGLRLQVARTPGFDAIGKGSRAGVKYQIKGRAISLDDRYRGKVPKIVLDSEFDAVLLVLIDKATYDAVEIWEASREYVERRLNAPGSKSRKRGSMNISQFKSDQNNNARSKRIWISDAVLAYDANKAAAKLAERLERRKTKKRR